MGGKKKKSKKYYERIKVGLVFVLFVEVLLAGWAIMRLAPDEPQLVNQTMQSEESKTVVAVGDIACDPNMPSYNNGEGTASECKAQATADVAKSIDPDYVLPLGDLQYFIGTLAEFQSSYDKSWGALKSISKPVPGNHEYATHDAKGYYDYFGQNAGLKSRGYYSYSVGAWHIIALNSNCQFVGGCQIGSPQDQWLGADLAKHKNKCTLAYWHHPLFSSGKHGNYYNVLPLWQRLANAKADVVLAGHDHVYERFSPQGLNGESELGGITQFTVGTGGKDLYPFTSIKKNSLVRHNSSFGVLKLTLDKDSYSWDFVSTQPGLNVDTGTARCI